MRIFLPSLNWTNSNLLYPNSYPSMLNKYYLFLSSNLPTKTMIEGDQYDFIFDTALGKQYISVIIYGVKFNIYII